MQAYLNLYETLGLPSFAIELAGEKHSCEWFEPVRWRCFPPALLPLFQHWNKDYGYWKHWFTPDRQLTLVTHQGVERLGRVMSISEMIGGLDPSRKHELLVTEIATDLNQLLRIHVLDWLCNGADEWTDEIRAFAKSAGLSDADIEHIDAISHTDYRPVAFLGDALFATRPPISCFADDIASYRGDFPHLKMDLTESALKNICSYEIHSSYMYEACDSDSPDIRETIAELAHSPDWLRSDQQQQIFDTLIDVGDLSGAWMSLNSFAWVCSDAAQAIQRLASAANDEQFSLLADAYCSLDHDANDGY